MNNVRKTLMAIADGHEDLIYQLEQLAAVVVYADADKKDVYEEYPDAVEMAYQRLGLEREQPST